MFDFRIWDIGQQCYIHNPDYAWFRGYLHMSDNIGVCDWFHDIRVSDLFEIEYYTGLNDCAGKPIFQGDIVLLWGDEYVVRWSRGTATFYLDSESDEIPSKTFSDVRADEVEVIDTVHEQERKGERPCNRDLMRVL